MKTEQEVILLDRLENGIGKITFNTPPLNLMTTDFNRCLTQKLMEIREDDEIRVVIITGAGTKAFSAGADIKEFAKFIAAGTMIQEKLRQECATLDLLELLPQPTIAAVNGVVLGGGLELLLCCDYIILPDHIKLGFPEIQLGLFPGSGGLVRLPKRIGAERAKELMLFGKMLTAQEAKELKLANEILPADEVYARALTCAEQLARMPRHALRAVKQGIYDSILMPTQQGVQYSLGLMSQLLSDPDCWEGVEAFLQKREPHFNRS